MESRLHTRTHMLKFQHSPLHSFAIHCFIVVDSVKRGHKSIRACSDELIRPFGSFDSWIHCFVRFLDIVFYRVFLHSSLSLTHCRSILDPPIDSSIPRCPRFLDSHCCSGLLDYSLLDSVHPSMDSSIRFIHPPSIPSLPPSGSSSVRALAFAASQRTHEQSPTTHDPPPFLENHYG